MSDLPAGTVQAQAIAPAPAERRLQERRNPGRRAGTTKNGDGRVFKKTDDVRALLHAGQAEGGGVEKQR